MIKTLLLTLAPKLFLKSSYFSDVWRKKRSFILSRDRYKCRVCNRKRGLHVHHLHDKSTYPRMCLMNRNLITLCKECHYDFHKWNGGTRKSCTSKLFLLWHEALL
jgi:5-methylcytosine-specific restriction endonuclease McrA